MSVNGRGNKHKLAISLACKGIRFYNETMIKILSKSLLFTSLLTLAVGVVHADTVPNNSNATVNTDSTSANPDTLSTNVYQDPRDPYENFNRHTYRMNDTLDRAILKPVATVYTKVLPHPLRQGVGNFFDNLAQIPTIINDLLQAKLKYTVSDSMRLILNSTIGIGGLFDVATHMGIAPHSEDLGLTLAQWGYHSSAYFIIPLLGPSTLRDAGGMVPNYYFFTVYPHINIIPRYALLALNGIDTRAQFLDYDNTLQMAAVDPYAFQRDAYLQHRAFLIAQNSGVAQKDTYVAGSDN